MSLHIPNGKPGGITLPAIPEDVLAEYPYTAIFKIEMSDGTVGFIGILSKSAFYFCKTGVVNDAQSNDMVISLNTSGAKEFEFFDGNTGWGEGYDSGGLCIIGSDIPATNDTTCTVGIVWSNHDIQEVTEVNGETGEFTTATEVYFSERQNFNGVWLPKIPDGFEVSYPYVLINKIKMTYSDDAKQYGFSDIECYMLIMSPNPCVYAKDKSTNKQYLGCVSHYSYSAESIGNEWDYINEDLELTVNDVTNEVLDGVGSAEFDVVYSNHDILNANINSDGSITVLETVYINGTGTKVPEDVFAVDHDSMVFIARAARKLSNKLMTPITLEQSMNIFDDIETYEDAEGMVF